MSEVERDQVRIVVTAERGSRVIVDESDEVVHRATATGQEQTLRFQLADGRHQLRVHAVDAAGNTSPHDFVSVTTDGTPPTAPTIVVGAWSAKAPTTQLEIVGEADDAYVAVISNADGASVHEQAGKLASGRAAVAHLLPDGQYSARVTLTDAAGNESSPVTAAFSVLVPVPPAPTVRVLSKPGENPLRLSLRGVPHGTARLILTTPRRRATTREVELGSSGAGRDSINLENQDGEYTLNAIVTDFQGRGSPQTRLSRIPIDTTPPKLTVDIDEAALSEGEIRYSITMDEAGTVAIDLGGVSQEKLESVGGVLRGTISASSGEHLLNIKAVDKAGNEAFHGLPVTVTVSLSAWEWVIFLALVGLFVIAPPVVIIRRRRRIIAWLRARLRLTQPSPALAAEEQATYDVGSRGLAGLLNSVRTRFNRRRRDKS